MRLDEIEAGTWKQIEAKFPETNFLQSPAWGKMNEEIGHKVRVEHFGSEAWCLMIIKNARRGRYLEIPGGPLVDWGDTSTVRRLFTLVKKTAKAERCVFIRLRPQVLRTEMEKVFNLGLGFKKAPMHLHAEHTVMLDLSKTEDELLKAMRRQTRYEVRRADKLGITVDAGSDERRFIEFQAVQAETAARQHFVPPDLKTLLAERKAFTGAKSKETDALIYIARTGVETGEKAKLEGLEAGRAIAYGLVLISGREAEYFEAASTELNNKLPGAYALLWRAMKDLKKRQIERFNLWGIAPLVNGKPEAGHRYAGVTTFKTGFGGEIVEFMPAADLVLSRTRYAINWLIETVRKKKRHL